MTEELAKMLASIAVRNNIINGDDCELYGYSYQILIERFVSWSCILLISLLFRTILYTLIFIVLFGALRMFTGGWHAANFRICFLISVGIFLCFSCAEACLVELISANLMMITILACGFFIAFLGPIADSNKPMEFKRMMSFRKVSLLILLIELLVASNFFISQNKHALLFSLYSFLMLSIPLCIGHCKKNPS